MTISTFENVHNELDDMKRKKELEITGFPYHRQDITREELIKKYGKNLVESIDESHCDGWLELRNNQNHRMFVEHYQHIPMGLEKKISLGWFMHFFSWMKMDTYSVDIDGASFHGNWLDVPYPYADHIVVLGNHFINDQELPDPCYNWYELFLIIDEMMWGGERCLDIGITSVGIDHRYTGKAILVGWSS